MKTATKIIVVCLVLFMVLGFAKEVQVKKNSDFAKESFILEQLHLPKFICSQMDVDKTPSPNKFKTTPKQVLETAEKYFLSNPFVLKIYADNKYYYVDIATLGSSAKRAEARGLKIDGNTGVVVRGKIRDIGK